MRNFFDREMTELEISVIKLCNIVVDSMVNLETVFIGKKQENVDFAKDLFNEAKMLSNSIESRCVKLLIHQQPVASDLRQIKSAMTVIVDLVRVPDQCMHIADLNLELGKYATPKRMLEMAKKMVEKSVDGYIRKDTLAAETVIKGDDEVDEIFVTIKHDLVNVLKSTLGKDDWVLDCLLAAKYLERIADHAVNIANFTYGIA